MRRTLTAIGATLTTATLTASVALAGGGVSGVAKGHGQAVSEVANAVTYVSGKARGEAVSALAKQHGAIVSAAARAQHGNASSHKTDHPTGDSDEPGGLKDDAGS
jgi:hypothetical protein